MKTICSLVTLLSALAVATPSFAQIDTSLADDARLVRSVTLADLEALIAAEGHEISEAYINEGEDGSAPIVVATDAENGWVFGAFGTACTGSGDATTCNGINFMATWDRTDANSDPATINALNESRAAVSVFMSDNSVGTSRYVILDGGQTMENIKVNLQVFLSITNELSVNF